MKKVFISLTFLILIIGTIAFPKNVIAADYTVSSDANGLVYSLFGYRVSFHETTTVQVLITHDGVSGQTIFQGGSLYGGKITEVNAGYLGYYGETPVYPSGGRLLGSIPSMSVSGNNSITSQAIIIPPDIEVMYFVFGNRPNPPCVVSPQVHGGSGRAYVQVNYNRIIGEGDWQYIINQINNPTYGLSALNTKINNLNTKIESLQTPVITKVSTTNGATASKTGQSPPIIVTASGADEFGLSLNGTDWVDGFDISTGSSINSLSSGINNIRVRAYDSSVPAEKRKYAYGNILIFGL